MDYGQFSDDLAADTDPANPDPGHEPGPPSLNFTFRHSVRTS
jgi:hypothetical protein